MSRTIRIAAAAYPFDWFDDLSAYEAKITRWVAEAADCDLLVFPEYGAMELASLGGPAAVFARLPRHGRGRAPTMSR